MLTFFQVFISILLIALVLIQERSSGLSGTFGGGETFHHERRGFEKIIFYATVLSLIIFITLSILSIII